MSSFTTPLIGEWMDGRHWRLHEPFTYRIGAEGCPEHIDVPEGFVTDFASVPRIFWTILPPTGPYGKAAVIHDALYHNIGILWEYALQPNNETGPPVIITKSRQPNRKEADDIMREGMIVLGVNAITRETIYCGLRLVGSIAWWKGHRRAGS